MSPRTKLLSTLLAAGFATACANTTVDDSSTDRRGAIGKADTVTGSCAESDACGDKSDGSCWCDAQCWWFGDCCDDAAETCGVDECNASSNTGCQDGATCEAGNPNTCESSTPDCSPQDAQGVGMCEMFMGYKWTGTECQGVSGCSCTGADCGSLTDLEICEAAHAECAEPPQTCGGIYYNPCPDEDQFCNYGDHCGTGDQSGVCEPIPHYCTEAWAPVCGCDGRTYGNTCKAHQHGMSVASFGECGEEPAGNSCADHCGVQSEDESCWCDSLCDYYGDCCADKAELCD